MKCFGSARVQKILEDIKILNGQNFEIKDKCYEYVQAEMKKLNNPYILLAYKFVLYNNGIQDQTEDYDFYKYLKSGIILMEEIVLEDKAVYVYMKKEMCQEKIGVR